GGTGEGNGPGGGQVQLSCAAWCAQIYPPGRLRGKCIDDATHGVGRCYECGPAAPPGHGPICGTENNRFCCSRGESCCGGACVDPFSDAANCGGCGVYCRFGQTCCNGHCLAEADVCTGGQVFNASCQCVCPSGCLSDIPTIEGTAACAP